MIFRFILVFLIFFFCPLDSESLIDNKILIRNSIDNPNRLESNVKRDIYRNPYDTLLFFELEQNKKVLEVSPGSGWYTEILSYFMKNTDNFYVTHFTNPPSEILSKIQNNFNKYFEINEKKFGNFNKVKIDKGLINDDSKNNYFDLVLTFRNNHNWLDAKIALSVYESFNKVMKKGAILGVVQHRESEDAKKNFNQGYVKESFLMNLIESKGFKLVSKSEINANAKDTKNYENGVWTLPPRLVNKKENAEKYISIGESDRMTLKFKKIKNL